MSPLCGTGNASDFSESKARKAANPTMFLGWSGT